MDFLIRLLPHYLNNIHALEMAYYLAKKSFSEFSNNVSRDIIVATELHEIVLPQIIVAIGKRIGDYQRKQKYRESFADRGKAVSVLSHIKDSKDKKHIFDENLMSDVLKFLKPKKTKSIRKKTKSIRKKSKK